jgi:hypothetical protein
VPKSKYFEYHVKWLGYDEWTWVKHKDIHKDELKAINHAFDSGKKEYVLFDTSLGVTYESKAFGFFFLFIPFFRFGF